jgi:hypothetical protein
MIDREPPQHLLGPDYDRMWSLSVDIANAATREQDVEIEQLAEAIRSAISRRAEGQPPAAPPKARSRRTP